MNIFRILSVLAILISAGLFLILIYEVVKRNKKSYITLIISVVYGLLMLLMKYLYENSQIDIMQNIALTVYFIVYASLYIYIIKFGRNKNAIVRCLLSIGFIALLTYMLNLVFLL